MNKIISITIGGQVFQIVDNAYDKLHIYLEKLTAHFSKDESGQEIIDDIESRMAELLLQKLSSRRQHIIFSDVEEVIETLGNPEMLTDEENTSPKDQPFTNQQKRLFRDPDNEKIAGVCGGLGAYFNTDPLWFRIAFVVLLLLFGTGILMYIVLAVLVPKANTAADKLMMHGEMPSLKNIEESIKQRAEALKNEFKDGNALTGIKKFFYLVGQLFERAFHVFGFIIGLAISIGLIILLIVVITGHPEFNFNNINIPGKEGWMMFFDNTWELLVFKSLLVALLLLPAISFLVKIWKKNKAKKVSGVVNWSLSFLWTVVILSALIFSIYIGKRFKTEATVVQSNTFIIPSDTLLVSKTNSDKFKMTWNNGESEELDIQSHASVVFKPSNDSSFHINLLKKSRGIDKRTAKNLASMINPKYKISGNEFLFPEEIILPSSTPWRAQNVKYQLEIPVGKYFYYTKTQNNHSDWDEDNEEFPIKHLYKMNSAGSECIDCRK